MRFEYFLTLENAACQSDTLAQTGTECKSRYWFSMMDQRHGISRLPEVEVNKEQEKKFKPYPIGFFHIDIAEVLTEEGKVYLFVSIDRTSKFVFAKLV